jgi:hypothetical protein
MEDLLPFAIVTLIVLVAFSFMYYIQNYGLEGYETFKDAFYSIFSQFVGGPEPATGPLDLVFGILSVVILLNVVIAIASTSWANAVDTSLILLCKYRLELLRQVDAFTRSKGFESLQCIPPDYDEDYDRFVETRILPLIRREHRGEEWWHLELSDEERKRWKLKMTLWSFCSPPLQAVLVVLPWILGLFTFGLLWPKHVRETLFGIVSEDNETFDIDLKPSAQKVQGEKGNERLLQIGRETENMKDEITKLRKDLAAGTDSSLEKRIGLIEEQMKEVSEDIKSIKQTTQDVLRLLMLQNTARSSDSDDS